MQIQLQIEVQIQIQMWRGGEERRQKRPPDIDKTIQGGSRLELNLNFER